MIEDIKDIEVTEEMIKAYDIAFDICLYNKQASNPIQSAIQASTQIQDLIAENKRLREALSKLVKLKEHKDNVGKDEYYHNNLLSVWDNAKKALTTTA